MRKKLLTLLALIGLAGWTIPVHAQVLKGSKEETTKASTKNAKAKKGAAPATSDAAEASATKKGASTTKNKGQEGAAKKNAAATKKGADKKMGEAPTK
jgi:hypothetical protein